MNLYYGTSYAENDDEYFTELIEKYKNDVKVQFKSGNVKFLTLINRNSLSNGKCFEQVNYFFENLTKRGLNPSDLVIGINNWFYEKVFSKKELSNLKLLTDAYRKVGTTVGILDDNEVFQYDYVKNASDYIQKQAFEINQNHYSPLEKLLHAYATITERKYKESDMTKELDMSRSVYGVLNSDKIVCVGFANLLTAIIKECRDQNLKVFPNDVGERWHNKDNRVEYEMHQNNIVYIKDDKYNIDGFYYLDPTWDQRKHLDGKITLSHFLTEIKNIDKIAIAYIDNYREINRKRISRINGLVEYQGKAPKTKGHQLTNLGSGYNSSITRNKAEFKRPVKHKLDNMIDRIEDYLETRQDFKDYCILEQTKRDTKSRKVSFDKVFEKNYTKGNDSPYHLDIYHSKKTMWNYLSEHSPHINIGPVNDALHVVYKNLNKNLTKDEVAKDVKEIIELNVDLAKEDFEKDSITTFTECEEEMK